MTPIFRATLPLVATLLALPLALAAATGPARAGQPSDDDPLAHHRWRDRVVVALAPTSGDPRLAEQRRLFAGFGPGGRERDLVLVAVGDDSPTGAALRRRFGGDPGGFVAVLVGKDGGEKMRSAAPLGRDALFPTVDAMPMRRGEMRRGEGAR